MKKIKIIFRIINNNKKNMDILIFRWFHLGGQSANDILLRKSLVFTEILKKSKNVLLNFKFKKKLKVIIDF